MNNRLLLLVSTIFGLVGLIVAASSFANILEGAHVDLVVLVLLFGSLFALGIMLSVQLRAVARNLALVRDRTKRLADGTTRSIARTDELHNELLLGSYSHVPGQIARIEGKLGASDQGPSDHRPPFTRPNRPDDVFDQVFVLNLDRDTDKLTATSRRLAHHNVAFVRFRGIDGLNLQFDNEWNEYIDKGPQLPPERLSGRRLIESRGAWGYLKSMQQLLQQAKAEGLRRILVLDDDVMFHKDFQDRFGDAWSELPEDWKVVYLGSAQVDRSKIIRYSDHLYHPGGMANGSYATALDSSVFDQALASIERFDWPFDAGALREIDTAYPEKVFVVNPPLLIADVSVSAIRPGRDMQAHIGKHGWNLSEYEL